MPEDTVLKLLHLWFNTWSTLELDDHVQNFVGGLLGAGVYLVLTQPVLLMPDFDIPHGKLKPNIAGTLFVGGIIALVVDVSFALSIVAGLLATPVLNLVLRKIIPSLGIAFLAALRAWTKETFNDSTKPD